MHLLCRLASPRQLLRVPQRQLPRGRCIATAGPGPCCTAAAARTPANPRPPLVFILQLFTGDPSVPVSTAADASGYAAAGSGSPRAGGEGTSLPTLGFGGGPQNTLDEPVWETAKRDLRRICKNLVREGTACAGLAPCPPRCLTTVAYHLPLEGRRHRRCHLCFAVPAARR